MDRKIVLIILFNVGVSSVFLFFNTVVWASYEAILITPFEKTLIQPWFTPPVVLPNFLFWLFWLSTAVNLYFIIGVQRIKETKSKI